MAGSNRPGGRVVKRIYLLLAALVVLLGLFHTGSTPRFFAELNSRALWFAGGGLLLVLTGVLNLLNRAYGTIARGVRWTAISTNLVMTAFAALAGTLGAASGIELAGIVGLMAATTLVSMLPQARA